MGVAEPFGVAVTVGVALSVADVVGVAVSVGVALSVGVVLGVAVSVEVAEGVAVRVAVAVGAFAPAINGTCAMYCIVPFVALQVQAGKVPVLVMG